MAQKVRRGPFVAKQPSPPFPRRLGRAMHNRSRERRQGGLKAAHNAAISAWSARHLGEERSTAELAQLLHGAHFLEMPNARNAIGREFCARLRASRWRAVPVARGRRR